MLVTLILDYEGGTYVSQVSLTHLSELRTRLVDVFDWTEVRPSPTPSMLKAFSDSVTESAPVAVSGLNQVWCVGGRLGGKLALVHVVNTVSKANDFS